MKRLDVGRLRSLSHPDQQTQTRSSYRRDADWPSYPPPRSHVSNAYILVLCQQRPRSCSSPPTTPTPPHRDETNSAMSQRPISSTVSLSLQLQDVDIVSGTRH